MPVRELAASLAFYRDVLGFEVKVDAPETGYGLVAREGAAVALVATGDAAALKATETNISAYIWVEDLAGLWEELRPALDALPEGQVRPPFQQDYGMREFHVKDPDGFLILFGEDPGSAA